MSAPPGFNPNASLLPDPGPSAAPIQVMRGGAAPAAAAAAPAPVATASGGFTEAETMLLQRYQLGPGGVIAGDIDEATKKSFLVQIKSPKSRCKVTTGDSIILGKDCDAIVKVIRALLNKKIAGANAKQPVAAPVPTAPTSESQGTQNSDENDITNENVANLTSFTNDESNENVSPGAPGAPVAPGAPGASGNAAEPTGQTTQENVRNIAPPVTNNNRKKLESFLKENENENETPDEKPSPCKNRGTRKNNGDNVESVNSVAEEERSALNAATAPKGGGKKTRKNRNKKSK